MPRMIDIDPVLMCPNSMKCTRRRPTINSPNMLRVDPIVRCPDSFRCPRSPRPFRRPRLAPIGAMAMLNNSFNMMGGRVMPTSPQMKPISIGQPMSLMSNGKNCIQFPYGTNHISTVNGMQGIEIPSSVIYNNGCFEDTQYTVLREGNGPRSPWMI